MKPDYSVFRTGGDEFLILCSGIDQYEFPQKIAQLKKLLVNNTVKMTLGIVWEEKCQENLPELLIEADNRMYQEKRISND